MERMNIGFKRLEEGHDIRSIIASLNFLLLILGYPIAMALLAPLGVDIDIAQGGNVFFTYPYRFFSVTIAVLALFVGGEKTRPGLGFNGFVFALFWIMYLLRAIYDLVIRSSPDPLAWNYKVGIEFQAWSYILFFTLLPVLALLRSFWHVNLRLVLNWIVYIGGIALVCSLWAVHIQKELLLPGEELYRVGATKMLNTIMFGQLGLSVAICAFLKQKDGLCGWHRVLCLLITGLGVYVLLVAGSRGPVLAMLVVVFILFLSISRNLFFLGVGLSSLFAFLLYIGKTLWLSWLGVYFPVMASRIEATLSSGDTSGRDELFSTVWDGVLGSPLTGTHLDFLGNSHNAILDGFMMFGLLGGWVVLVLIVCAFFRAYRFVSLFPKERWMAFLLIQSLVAMQVSDGLGTNGCMQALFLMVILYESSNKDERIGQKVLFGR